MDASPLIPEDLIKRRLLRKAKKKPREESRFHSVWAGSFHRRLCERQIPRERLSGGGRN